MIYGIRNFKMERQIRNFIYIYFRRIGILFPAFSGSVYYYTSATTSLKGQKKKKRPIENKLPSYRLTTDKHFSPIKVYLSTF